jgi:hypothetical protein
LRYSVTGRQVAARLAVSQVDLDRLHAVVEYFVMDLRPGPADLQECARTP